MRVVLGFAILSMTILLAGCSGSDSGDESSSSIPTSTSVDPTIDVAALGDQMGAFLWDNQPPDQQLVTVDQFNCVGREFISSLVEQVGQRALIDAGFGESIGELGDVIDNDQFDMLFLGGIEACTDLVRIMSNEVAQAAGWSEQSTICLFEGLLANDATRPLIAWGIGTVGSLGPALERMDPETLAYQIFDCLNEKELTAMLLASSDPVPGVSELSLVCVMEGLLADEVARGAFRLELETADVAQLIRNVSDNLETAEVLDTLASTCLSDDERSALFGS